jgi:fibronectin type 3 domain-containing protein
MVAQHEGGAAGWALGIVVLLMLAAPAGAGMVRPGASASAVDAAPSAPINLDVHASGLQELTIVWDHPGDGSVITNWSVYRGGTPDAVGWYDSALPDDNPADGHGYVDVELGDGETLCYAAIAWGPGGGSPLSNVDCETTWNGPSAPRDFAGAALGAASIQLMWEKPASDGGQPIQWYRIWRDTNPSGVFPFLDDVEEDVRSFTDSGLPSGSRYYYKIAGYNAVGFGANTKTGAITTLPGAPGGLVAASGRQELALSWAAAPSQRPILAYHVEVQDATGFFTPLATLGDVRSFVHAGLGDGAARTYRVIAENEGGRGAPSAPSTGTTYSLPSMPRSVAAQPGPGAEQVRVTWQPPDPDGLAPLTYLVLGGDAADALALLGETSALAFTESGLAPGVVRFYRVLAANVVGEGPASQVVSAAAPTLPTAPLNLAARGGLRPGQAVLTWQPPTSAGGLPVAGYRIYRGPVGEPLVPLTSIGDQLTYTDNAASLTENQVYAVAARTNAGEGPRSSEACTGAWPQPLSAPLGEACPLPSGWEERVLLDETVPLNGATLVQVEGHPDPQSPSRYLVTVTVMGEELPAVGLFVGGPLPPLSLAAPPEGGDARVTLAARYDARQATCLASLGAECAASAPFEPGGWLLTHGREAEVVLRLQAGGEEHVVRAPLAGQAGAALG